MTRESGEGSCGERVSKEGKDMETALVGLLGVIAGTVIGAVLQEWRARNDEGRAVRRQRLQRAADFNLRRLTATRRRLGGEAEWAIAYGIASSTDVDRALIAARGTDVDGADTVLVGDDAAVLRWIAARDAIVDRGRMRGQDLALVQEVYDARDACFDAIDEQIRRALNDVALPGLGPDARAAMGKARFLRT
jgi:hypothetical protein